MSRNSRKAKAKTTPPRVVALIATSLAVGWVWLVASTHVHEMIVGAVVVVLATLFVVMVQKSQRETLKFRWKDVVQCWRVPWYIVARIWEISVLLFKDLFFIRRAGSYYRVCGFKSSRRDPEIVAREVLATIYTTMAPNFIVIGIDPDLSRMLFHQIERSGVSKMTQALGAQS
jgi:hypothetical protein